jgi:hypothetical protein
MTIIGAAMNTEFAREFSGNEFAIKDGKRTEVPCKIASPKIITTLKRA